MSIKFEILDTLLERVHNVGMFSAELYEEVAEVAPEKEGDYDERWQEVLALIAKPCEVFISDLDHKS